MASGERWGKERKYTPPEGWGEYNRKLVRRGELYLDLDFLDSWDSELDIMNSGKDGRPFRFPDKFIHFLGNTHYLCHLPYRQLSGVVTQLSRYIPRLNPTHFTNIQKRLRGIYVLADPVLDTSDEPVVIALDSSGVKVTNRGEWMRKKWKSKKGWLKIHLAVDVKTKKIISMKVTKETVGDNRKFKPMLRDCKKKLGKRKIKRVLADGAYDARKCYNALDKGTDAGIKPRKNASTKAKGSPTRKKAVLEYREQGYDGWKKNHNYGERWAVEGTLSTFKRTFGEYVSSRTLLNMKKELMIKTAIINNIF
jgi:transposase